MIRATCFAILLLTTSCTVGTSGSKEPSPTPVPPSIDVSGRWSYVCCDGKFSGSLVLRQKGSALEGTLDGFPVEGEPTVTGTIEATVVHLTRSLTVGKQEFSLVADGTGKAMQGTFSGNHDPAFGTDVVARYIGKPPE